MNILMMTNTYFPIMGGLEKSIKSFTGQLRRRRHQVTIVVPEYKGRPKRERGVTRIPAIQNFNGTDFSLNLPIPGMLEELMDRFRPDVVHAHHPFWVGDLALRLAGQYEVPHVFTYHTMFDQYTHYMPVNNENVRRFITQLSAGYANLSDHVIVPSESVEKVLRERGVKTPMTVVPTGVNVRAFARGNGRSLRQKESIPPEAFVVGHIGRLAEEKNLRFLTDGMVRFLKEHAHAHFLVAGSGPSREELEKRFSDEHILERVHFTGALSGQDLIDAYHAMNVFAFASKSETQGMVLVEAMSAGVPVIGLDAPGVREVIENGDNGWLVAEEDAEKFSRAIAETVRLSHAQIQKMQERARHTAEKFSIQKTTLRLIQVYRAVRRRHEPLRERDDNTWRQVSRRMRTEWEMLSNLGKAAGAAMFHSPAHRH